MQRLIMQDAIDDKDSCFDAKMCFDYEGRTYEYLPPHPILPHVGDDGGPHIRYRFILGPVDYDYVDVGGVFETEQQVKEFTAKLDEYWQRYNITQPIESRADGERFIKSMHELGLLWHFDDDPSVVGHRVEKSGGEWMQTFTDEEAIELRKRVKELHKLDWAPYNNVFDFTLTLTNAEEQKSSKSKLISEHHAGSVHDVKMQRGFEVSDLMGIPQFAEQIERLEQLKGAFKADPVKTQEVQQAIDLLKQPRVPSPLPTRRKPISFDVSSEFSLDALRKDMELCMKNSESKCYFDIRGPAGGNTNVLFYAADDSDKEAVIAYVRQHKLAPI